MRIKSVLFGGVAVAALIGLSAIGFGSQRGELLKLSWGSAIPAPGDPLMVYVTGSPSKDQERFDDVVMKNESMLLAAKFFKCVEMSEDDVRQHPLFEKVKFKAPTVVAFDSTREKRAVAGGRASGMKIYSMLCKVGQLDYETKIAGTVRAARNCLGNFDRIDAAQSAIGIKHRRLSEAQADGDSAKIRKLQREVDKDQKAIDELVESTNTLWTEIWDIKRKEREDAAKPGDTPSGKDGK